MGNAVDWQQEVIRSLSDLPNLVIFNPRREYFAPEMEDEQIRWELSAMESANFILMWLPKDAEAPVSFLELGLYLKSDKLILGVENGFVRQRNVEITAQRYGVDVYHTLSEVIAKSRLAIEQVK